MAPRNNRRNATAAPAATTEQDAPAAPELELDAPVTDAPAPELDAPVQVTPQDAPEPANPGTDDAPAAQPDDAPAPAVDAPVDAPAPAADAPEEPAVPEDAPAPVADGDAPRPLTFDEMLAGATLADAAPEAREDAFVGAALVALRDAVARTAALPDDAPRTAEMLHVRINGASGRSVEPARLLLRIAQAMLGCGVYNGSTHGSIKATEDSDRRMQVYVMVPALLAPAFAQLAAALEHATGPVVPLESAAYAQGNLALKNGATGGHYQVVLKAGRSAVVAVRDRLAARLTASFQPADDELPVVREMIRCAHAEYLSRVPYLPMTPAQVIRNTTPVTDRFPALQAVTV